MSKQMLTQPPMDSRAYRGFVISHLILSDNMTEPGSPKIRDLRCGVVSDNLNGQPLGEKSFPGNLRHGGRDLPHLLLHLVVDDEHCELRAALLAIGLA